MGEIIAVLPTYNEKQTIAEVIHSLRSQNITVVVVDDNSPDGTGKIVKKIHENDALVHILTGQKKGLGYAYRKGFKYSLRLKPDIILQMDSDLSHNPTDVTELVNGLQNADVCIGSRYVQGGSTPGWPTHRRWMSWTANLFSRFISGMYTVRDTTSGFRAIRASSLQKIQWDSLPAKGYSFQILLLHTLMQKGASIKEVPIEFTDREYGKTKMRFFDITEFIAMSFRLGWRTYGRLVKFFVVGASGLLVNLGMFSGTLDYTQSVWIAWIVAVETSILWNFLLHDLWTFRDRHTTNMISRMTKYHATSLGGIAINFAIFSFLLHYMFVSDKGANMIAVLVASIWNFTLSTKWAWRKEKKK